MGDDGGCEGGELHRGASRRGGSGPTAAYHYNNCQDWSIAIEGSRAPTPQHSSHSPASSLCRWRRPRTTSSNAKGTPLFATGLISNSALRAGSLLSLPPAHLYREIAGRETADIDPGTGSAPRRRRSVGGGEWSAGGCWGVGGHEERESLLVRSRWEGVEGCQKVRAKRWLLDTICMVRNSYNIPCESSCVCDISSKVVSSFSSRLRLR